jgi:hypothetical protein
LIQTENYTKRKLTQKTTKKKKMLLLLTLLLLGSVGAQTVPCRKFFILGDKMPNGDFGLDEADRRCNTAARASQLTGVRSKIFVGVVVC